MIKMIFRDFSDFSIAGINEKKNIIIMKKKKRFWYRTWATAQVSLRLGWALGAGRAGAGRAGTAQAAWARGRGAHGLGVAGRWARLGRAGWPWAVHSVHSAHFRSVLTRFFS